MNATPTRVETTAHAARALEGIPANVPLDGQVNTVRLRWEGVTLLRA